MTNDTAVFDALRFDPQEGEIATGRIGTREAILRDGLLIDPSTLAYCPHQWIDGSGYLDLDLTRQFPYLLAL
ncbi:hypothetical protein AB7M17_005061 [Bradyrhizobium sp. USDA 377]